MTRSEHLPPRRSLPRDVVVPVLPALGLTWYDHHGASYWARRAGLSFLWAMMTAFVGLVTGAALVAFHNRSLAGFLVVLVIEVVYALGILGFILARTARRWNAEPVGRPFGRGWVGAPRPAGRGPGYVLGQILLAVGCLSVGLYLGLLMTSLLPETLVERQARRWVAGELLDHGHGTPGP